MRFTSIWGKKLYLWDGMMQNKLIELSLQAIKWNEKRLPNNTLEMQLKKVDEEFEEATEAADESENIKELADVFIALSGVGRFSVEKYYAGLFAFFLELNNTTLDLELLQQEVEKKLNVIEQLDYVIQDGVYHHTLLN